MFEDDERIDFDDLMHFVETSIVNDNSDHSARRHFGSKKINPAMAALDPKHPWHAKTLRFNEGLKKFQRGRLGEGTFMEAVSSSDFPQLSANTLQWRLLAMYGQVDFAWEQMVDINDTIPDFRQVKLTRMEGFDGPMKKVRELADYPMDAPTASDQTYGLAKYGKVVSLSWEASMNDYLQMFKKWPGFLARACRATENFFFTTLLVNQATPWGPNPALFSTDGSTNGGVSNMATAAPLNETNLVAAYVAMTTRKVASGNPMSVQPKFLVVPPQLKFAAEKLLESAVLIPTNISTGGTLGSNPVMIPAANAAVKLGLTIVEMRWLGNVDLSANVGNTWYLLGDPGAGAAIELGFLIGHRQPQIFRRISGAQEGSGNGIVDPSEGDFEHDAQSWKARHVIGGSTIEPRYAYASVGA